MAKKKYKEPVMHIHMCPKLQDQLNKANAKIEELQNQIWDYKRNERHYKDAIFALLSVINSKQMRK